MRIGSSPNSGGGGRGRGQREPGKLKRANARAKAPLAKLRTSDVCTFGNTMFTCTRGGGEKKDWLSWPRPAATREQEIRNFVS